MVRVLGRIAIVNGLIYGPLGEIIAVREPFVSFGPSAPFADFSVHPMGQSTADSRNTPQALVDRLFATCGVCTPTWKTRPSQEAASSALPAAANGHNPAQ
jgi:hypothetical protein